MGLQCSWVILKHILCLFPVNLELRICKVKLIVSMHLYFQVSLLFHNILLQALNLEFHHLLDRFPLHIFCLMKRQLAALHLQLEYKAWQLRRYLKHIRYLLQRSLLKQVRLSLNLSSLLERNNELLPKCLLELHDQRNEHLLQYKAFDDLGMILFLDFQLARPLQQQVFSPLLLVFIWPILGLKSRYLS